MRSKLVTYFELVMWLL